MYPLLDHCSRQLNLEYPNPVRGGHADGQALHTTVMRPWFHRRLKSSQPTALRSRINSAALSPVVSLAERFIILPERCASLIQPDFILDIWDLSWIPRHSCRERDEWYQLLPTAWPVDPRWVAKFGLQKRLYLSVQAEVCIGSVQLQADLQTHEQTKRSRVEVLARWTVPDRVVWPSV